MVVDTADTTPFFVCVLDGRQVSVVMEQTIRLLHHCGMPMDDVDFINCDGTVMHGSVLSSSLPPRMFCESLGGNVILFII